MVAREMYARCGDERNQTGDEIQRLEKDMGGAVAVRRLPLVADVIEQKLLEVI